MKEKRYIDLHLHSTNSDGERSVEEIIKDAMSYGMSTISITDHNYFSLRERKQIGNLEIVPGCEFSTLSTDFGKRKEVHIIGLFYNGVREALDRIFDSIDKYAYMDAIIGQLNKLGINVSLAELLADNSMYGYIGRPQLADLLVKKGYANSRDEAMDKWIGNHSPYFINSVDFVDYIEMEECVKRIHAYGGLPILAHLFYYRYNNEEMEQFVARYRDMVDGPLGIEVYYKKYSPEQVAYLEYLADKYDLLPSASSDTHKREQGFSEGDYRLWEDMKNAMKWG